VAVTESEEISRRAADRIAEIGVALGDQLADLTRALHQVLADAIEPLQVDKPLLDLLYASIESNLETLVHIMRYDIPVEEVSSPSAAEEYARRLAQRGISSTALVRAYRLGQQVLVDWAFDELSRREPDPQVALTAGRRFTAMTFTYVDSISEQVVLEYESERERWLSNRNTVRVAMLEELISGHQTDAATAEQALGYRLRQQHLGVVLWNLDQKSTVADLRQLERFLAAIGKAAGAQGQPLFLPRDRSTAWGWVPLGGTSEDFEVDAHQEEVERAGSGLYAAFGTPGTGTAGFRVTHLEAVRARRVAIAAGATAMRLTTYADPEVRAAAMLAEDLEGTRRLVGKALGSLAADTEPAERLRDTLLTFLDEKGSYTATSARVHLHKNTVKYRIDKAVEERGRPLDEERLELELALVACRWLGASVLLADEASQPR
jgi:DNA-binding PucR family transcriptional regulator